MNRRLPTVQLALLVAASGVVVGGMVVSAAVPAGGVVAWGDNSYGQTGTPGSLNLDGTTAAVPVPTGVAGLSSGVSAISSHADHTLALMSDGSVRSWGFNAAGQLGNNSTANTDAPQTVQGFGGVGNLGGVTAVATGDGHSLALLTDGSLAVWGYNASGQLGDGSTTDQHVPEHVIPPQPFVAIAAGDNSSFGIAADGSLYAWGDNDHGQLVTSDTTEYHAPQYTGITGVVQVSSGHKHTVILLNGGTVRTVGANASGQLGDGSTINSVGIVNPGLTTVAGVAAGSDHTLALMADGTVQAWGGNAFGQVGDSTVIDRPSPQSVAGVTGVAEIAAGGDHSVALLSSGGVMAWGQDSMGELGDNSTSASPRAPSTVIDTSGIGGSTLTGVYQVAAGDEDTFALGGTPNQAGLVAKPDSIDFGSTIAGTVDNFRSTVVYVAGSALNTIASVTGVATPFSIPGGGDTCSTLTLMPGAVCSLKFKYAPTSTGPDSGVASIHSSAPTATVALAGTAVRYGTITSTGLTAPFSFGESCPANTFGQVGYCLLAGATQTGTAVGFPLVSNIPINPDDGTPLPGSAWVQPSLTGSVSGETLTAISCVDNAGKGAHNLYCYAVGGKGKLAACTTGGACAGGWTIGSMTTLLGPVSTPLYGISCVDPDHCVAVGANGSIYSTTQASVPGGNWVQDTSPTPSYLLEVACLTVSDCYAGGQAGVILTGPMAGPWTVDTIDPAMAGHDVNAIACAGSGKRYPCFAGTDISIARRPAAGPGSPAWSVEATGTPVLGLACGGDPTPTATGIDCTATGYSGTSLDSTSGTSWPVSAAFTNDELDGANCFYNSATPAFGFCNVFGQDPAFTTTALFGRSQLTLSQPHLAHPVPPPPPATTGGAGGSTSKPAGSGGQPASGPAAVIAGLVAHLPFAGGTSTHHAAASATHAAAGATQPAPAVAAGGPPPALLDPGAHTVPGRIGVATRDVADWVRRSLLPIVVLLGLAVLSVAIKRSRVAR